MKKEYYLWIVLIFIEICACVLCYRLGRDDGYQQGWRSCLVYYSVSDNLSDYYKGRPPAGEELYDRPDSSKYPNLNPQQGDK